MDEQSIVIMVAMRSRIRGHDVPAPRLTRWGALAIALYLGLPVLGILALADLALYVVFTRLLRRCYGLLCWLG